MSNRYRSVLTLAIFSAGAAAQPARAAATRMGPTRRRQFA